MQAYWTRLVVGATPVALSATRKMVSRIFAQQAPGNTGNVKVGGAQDMTADETTPGTILAPSVVVNPDGSKAPGESWSVETHDSNTLDLAAYFVHGTHAGDVVLVNYHEN